ncbi:hypothetical protein AR274_20240 [Stenotrophomonas maltophilia]|nr:hypothetical protein AR274_20240 [Stenotrophomonas maltophilia]
MVAAMMVAVPAGRQGAVMEMAAAMVVVMEMAAVMAVATAVATAVVAGMETATATATVMVMAMAERIPASLRTLRIPATCRCPTWIHPSEQLPWAMV